jgi:hypothetical protein
MINWSAFTWDAFATLLTGILAVGAAFFVGRRQVEISNKQNSILSEQARLSALTYRSDLFEHRFEVYDATSRFLGTIIAHADRPDVEVERRFLIALDRSKFLFAPEVTESLRTIWKEACAFSATKAQMQANYNRTGSYGDGMPQKELEQITKLHERLENLSDTFGLELRLSEVPPIG